MQDNSRLALPAGDVWLDAINEIPQARGHLAIYDQHVVGLNAADAIAWAAGSWKAIPQTTLTGTATDTGQRIAKLTAQGITEIIYQPAGPDIPGELKAFLAAATSCLCLTSRETRSITFCLG